MPETTSLVGVGRPRESTPPRGTRRLGPGSVAEPRPDAGAAASLRARCPARATGAGGPAPRWRRERGAAWAEERLGRPRSPFRRPWTAPRVALAAAAFPTPPRARELFEIKMERRHWRRGSARFAPPGSLAGTFPCGTGAGRAFRPRGAPAVIDGACDPRDPRRRRDARRDAPPNSEPKAEAGSGAQRRKPKDTSYPRPRDKIGLKPKLDSSRARANHKKANNKKNVGNHNELALERIVHFL